MKRIEKKKTIGILGGMGPAASAYCYQRLIQLAQEKYGAKEDYDFPPICVHNLSLSDLNEEGVLEGRKSVVGAQLKVGIEKLEQSGSDFVIIPCNTVHYFIEEMKSATRVPILSIIEETARKVELSKCEVVGVLGTKSTLRWGLYEKALKEKGINVVTPDRSQQKIISKVIFHVQEGSQSLWDRKALNEIAEDLVQRGAEGVILGCTELPLAIRKNDTDIRLFDSSSILAEAALAYAISKKYDRT